LYSAKAFCLKGRRDHISLYSDGGEVS
jgi:hypothetical protein